MPYQNMIALNQTPSQVVSQFAKNCDYYRANPNDIEIGDIELRNSYNYRGENQQNTAYRLTWFTGRGYQLYMFTTGVMVSNPDEHHEECCCDDCESVKTFI